MATRKNTVSVYVQERDLCARLGFRRIVTARWIGTGERKLVIVGER